ncbi:MFS transporter [Ktedonosporobacter rubrisoli]|uniref:MFS transporter n=1 Tax=Ktedonosporobacter rubrisoli TaxID=2509675 RepID=A0A4P6JJL8_KTERU|nr:MFS transporter [Ktedonosporobacter rubrisoli]QBD74846.1 MFS transporter [Ktedonosporobacter rubrisoli]
MQKAAILTQGMRWRIPLVLAVTLFVNYLDRNNLALALPQIAHDYGWSNKEIGSNGQFLLAAFFLAYGLSNMLLSPFAERFGPKRSMLIAITAFSVCTILSAPLGQMLAALIGLRLLLGVGEGMHVPMMSAITSRWFAAHERSRANAIWNVGILVATALGPLLLVPLISMVGWRIAFAVLGCVGLLISVPLVWLVVADNPTQEAMTELQAAQVAELVVKNLTISSPDQPAASYVRDRRFWLYVCGGALNAFCGFGVLNWLPTYFTRAKGINFDQLGWPLALVFTSGIVSVFIMAYLGDKLNRRAFLASVGLFLAGVLVFFAATANGLVPLVSFFSAAVFCQSAYTAQEYAIVQRLVPQERVGAGTGLYNGISILIGGVGGSLIPGTIVALTGNFNAGILSIMVGALLAALVLALLARALKY